MPSLRCSICLDSISSASRAMTTLCGHIYCLDCATFHFSRDGPSCAVCRTPQSLERMIRLFPDWDSDESRNDTGSAVPHDSVSSSPVSVRSIERAAEEAIVSVQHALADQEQPRDAILTCNTFVNSVTDREKPLINTKLLNEISFQLNLLSTKMKDDHDRLRRLTRNAQSARASETRLNLHVEQQRVTIDRLEKDNAQLKSQLEGQREDIANLQHQCNVIAEKASRQRSLAVKRVSEIEEMQKEKEIWKQQALKAKKKYYALKSKVEDTKRAALQAEQGHSRDTSDDLFIIG